MLTASLLFTFLHILKKKKFCFIWFVYNLNRAQECMGNGYMRFQIFRMPGHEMELEDILHSHRLLSYLKFCVQYGLHMMLDKRRVSLVQKIYKNC